MDDVSFDAFVVNPALYLTPPTVPESGQLVAWVKKRVEHGQWVSCGVSQAHRYCADNKALCLVSLPALDQLMPSAAGVKPCPTCAALYKQGVRTLDEATIVEAHRATLALQGVA